MRRLFILLGLFLTLSLSGQDPFMMLVASQGGAGGSTLTNGLLVYYKMDEVAGTNLNDEVSTNDATCNTDADVNATGKFGKAVDFTPDGGAITVPDEIFGTLSGMNFSVSLWIKFDALNLVERRIFSFLNGALAPIYEAQITNTGVITFYAVNNTPTQFYQTSSAETNTTDFLHYVFTCAPGTNTIHIYRNGVEVDGRTDDPTGTLPAFHATIQTIGNYFDGGSNSLDGKIDEFRIWNRALTPAEVVALYNLTP
jgi:hypothetical protein